MIRSPVLAFATYALSCALSVLIPTVSIEFSTVITCEVYEQPLWGASWLTSRPATRGERQRKPAALPAHRPAGMARSEDRCHGGFLRKGDLDAAEDAKIRLHVVTEL